MRGAKILISLLQSSLMVSLLAVFHVSSPESFGMFIGSVQMDDNSFFSNEDEYFMQVISLIQLLHYCGYTISRTSASLVGHFPCC